MLPFLKGGGKLLRMCIHVGMYLHKQHWKVTWETNKCVYGGHGVEWSEQGGQSLLVQVQPLK